MELEVGTSYCILKISHEFLQRGGFRLNAIFYYDKTNLFTLYFFITVLIRISFSVRDFVLPRFYHGFIGRQAKYKTKSWQIFQIYVLRFLTIKLCKSLSCFITEKKHERTRI